MMHKIKIISKMTYVLIPRIIRQQFLDDPVYIYKDILKNFVNKYKLKNNNQDNGVLTLQLAENIEELDCTYEILYKDINRDNYIDGPKIRIDNEDYYKSKLHNDLPDIKIYKIENVSVIGLSDAVIAGSKFSHHELNLMKSHHDLKRPEVFNKINESQYTIAVNYKKISKKNNIYISLLKEHSTNYFHWTTEGLPRLVLITDTLKKSKDFNINNYTLLIDENMPKQCKDMISLIVGLDIDIIDVKMGESFFCEQVIYCTPFWNALDNTQGLPTPSKEFFVDKYGLNLVKDTILKNYKPKKFKQFNSKKVYLQRLNNKLRPITNIHQVELLLHKADFEFVDVGSLSFEEQIELFQHVDIVIGVSGAAFTNLLFMKDGAKAVNFYPSVSSTNYYIFQPLADVSNVDLTHFLTIPNEGDNSIHGKSSIELENLELYLKEL